MRLTLRYGKELEVSKEVECEGEKTLFDVYRSAVQGSAEEGGIVRFVYKGQVLSAFTLLGEIDGLRDGDSIYCIRQQPPAAPSAPQALSPTPPLLSKVLQDPMMQMLLNSPDLMHVIFENSPQIQALKKSNSHISAILSDPSEVIEFMRTLSNPATAREVFRASDRALSNVDAMPGGMDAIRALYADITAATIADDVPEEPIHDAPQQLPERIEEDPFPRTDSLPSDQASPALQTSPTFQMPQASPAFQMQQSFSPFPFMFAPPPVPQPEPQTTIENMSDAQARVAYTAQILTLKQMGFDDEGEVLQALREAKGIINRALDILINRSSR